jgi:hypothetical protein
MSSLDRDSNPERSVPCGRDLHGPKFDTSTRPEKHLALSRSYIETCSPNPGLPIFWPERIPAYL